MAEATERTSGKVGKKLTRRGFLKAAAIGAAAAGAVAAAPALLSHGASALTANEATPLPSVGKRNPVVVYIRNAAKGEIVIMSGTREYVVKDSILASRLVAASMG